MTGKMGLHTLKGSYCLFQLQESKQVDNVLFDFQSPHQTSSKGEKIYICNDKYEGELLM